MSDEVEKRLVDIESKIQLLEQNIEHGKDMNRLLIDEMSRLLTRHDHILIGSNGDTGLVGDVKSLRDSRIGERLRSLETTVIRWGGAIGLATILFPLLVKILWP